MSSRPVDKTEERGVEGTSKFITPVKDMSESDVNPEDGALASKGKEKRKHKKDAGVARLVTSGARRGRRGSPLSEK